MRQKELICAMALTRIALFRPDELLRLYRQLGSATEIVEHRKEIAELVPEATPRLCEALADMEPALLRAEAELEFARKHAISILLWGDAAFPQRLRECNDAPLVLFYRGTADLNKARVVCVVGTRHATIYGQELVRRLMADLGMLCPDTLVVSGLAYGIDIQAHRQALQNGLPTVAVLAHGLDDLYPSRHRETAIAMLSQGGLITEFMSQTKADKVNFVRRNRIVAGLADACVVVESAERGGALITAGLSNDYNRETFAFPGRADDEFSAGCNQLIRKNCAQLINNAEELVAAMGWHDAAALKKAQEAGIERQLFPSLTADEQAIVAALQKENDQHPNMLVVKVGLPIGKLSASLFSLEMKGVVKALAGGVYHLIA